MKVSIATARGMRGHQEDRYFHLATATGTYVGVFDGHGGSECSVYCARRLPQILLNTPQVEAALALLNTEVRGYRSGSKQRKSAEGLLMVATYLLHTVALVYRCHALWVMLRWTAYYCASQNKTDTL